MALCRPCLLLCAEHEIDNNHCTNVYVILAENYETTKMLLMTAASVFHIHD